MAGATAAQVRHDVMSIGYSGTPTQGYEVEKLIESIGEFLDTPLSRNIALMGVGNLGRAILSDFAVRRPTLKIVAAFDVEPDRVNRVIHGCRCHSLEELQQIIWTQQIAIAIIAVPASEAQPIADTLCEAGICGMLNFAPVRLQVPQGVFVDDVNITIALEKVSYFAGRKALDRGRIG